MNETLMRLPHDWRWVKCSSVIDVRDGTHDTPAYQPVGIPFITSKNLVDGTIDFSSATFISEENHRKFSQRSKVDKGDILFAMIGTIGNPVLVDTEQEFSVKNVALFKFANSQVYNRYFRHLLDSNLIQTQMTAATRGGTQKFVSLKVLRDLAIPLPPLAEQKRIAAILDQADALRVKRRAALARLDRLVQAVFLEMFGDPVTNQVQSIGGMLENGMLLMHKDGNHGSNYPRAHEFQQAGVPFISAKNIFDNGDIDYTTIEYLSEAKASRLSIGWIQPGDVLLAHNATVGKVGLYRGIFAKALIGTSLTAFRPNSNFLTPEYLFASLRSAHFQNQLHSVMGQTTRNQVPITAQRRLDIVIPPIDKQHKFTKIQCIIDSQRNTQNQSLEKHTILFNSLQQRAFRGEL